MKELSIHVIARAVICLDGHVLVARCKGAGNTFLPGGHVKCGESMEDAISRELREEFGQACFVSGYLGAIEHAFTELDVTQHEVNHFFRVSLPHVRGVTPIVSLEEHLEFFWHPAASLNTINLMPAPVLALIQQPGQKAFWASTLKGNEVRPNKPLKNDARKNARAS